MASSTARDKAARLQVGLAGLLRDADAVLVFRRIVGGRIVTQQVLDREVLEEVRARSRAGRGWYCRARRGGTPRGRRHRRGRPGSCRRAGRGPFGVPTTGARSHRARAAAPGAHGRRGRWRRACGSGPPGCAASARIGDAFDEARREVAALALRSAGPGTSRRPAPAGGGRRSGSSAHSIAFLPNSWLPVTWK